MKTVVIGLGNPILTDDGVGIYTARLVAAQLPAGSEVDVIELSVGGLRLMEAMIGYQRAVIIDSLWSPDDEPGHLKVFEAGWLPQTLNVSNTHDIDLPAALRVGRMLGATLPDDQSIQIVGVVARRILEFGDRPTAPVARAIPVAVSAVLGLLGYQSTVATDALSLETCGGFDDFS